LRKFGILQHFESIVFSSDIKACKPNPKVFHSLLSSMSMEPADAIFVGDNIFDDIWGAKNVGMKTVWINRSNTITIPHGLDMPTPDVQISGDSYSFLADRILTMI